MMHVSMNIVPLGVNLTEHVRNSVRIQNVYKPTSNIVNICQSNFSYMPK
jgi:hypothetical protein